MNNTLLNNEDRMAFTRLFLTYKDKVYAIAYRMTGSASVAEDIVQDVFLKIWLRYHTLSEVTDFRAYLYTATRNQVYNALKKMALQQKTAMEAGALQQEEELSVFNDLQEKEYRQFLQQAISLLPGRQQQVYRLMEQGQHKREEVAQLLGLSPETVKQHLAQARRSVRAFCVAQLVEKGILGLGMIWWMVIY